MEQYQCDDTIVDVVDDFVLCQSATYYLQELEGNTRFDIADVTLRSNIGVVIEEASKYTYLTMAQLKEYDGKELERRIQEYLIKHEIPRSKIGICVEGFTYTSSFKLNEFEDFTAASVYKLPLAMLYYEKINAGELTLEDTFLYSEKHFEAGGPISYRYKYGDCISLKELLECMILYSDNTAGHILYENLGGWVQFKKASTKYSDMEYKNSFYVGSNILTAQYMNDALRYLYEHQEQFSLLLDTMKRSMPEDYLNLDEAICIPQKYGYYNGAVNAAGLSLENTPYSIVVFTRLGDKGIEHIGNINKICYDFFAKGN